MRLHNVIRGYTMLHEATLDDIYEATQGYMRVHWIT